MSLLDQATESVPVHRLRKGSADPEAPDLVVTEHAVTVMIEDVGSFTLMCTPADVEAMAVGFVFSEGMIDSVDDCLSVSIDPARPDVVGIRVEEPSRVATKRNLIVASSCGMCGVRTLEKMLSGAPVAGASFRADAELLTSVVARMAERQEVFRATGGSHAAAVFDAEGTIHALAEDIGRHTALDKAIGKCLLARLPLAPRGVALSGRASLEMVTKAARAGFEVIAAVSAPSSFAVEAARRMNLTLCGFVRPGRVTVYTHPERIVDVGAARDAD